MDTDIPPQRKIGFLESFMNRYSSEQLHKDTSYASNRSPSTASPSVATAQEEDTSSASKDQIQGRSDRIVEALDDGPLPSDGFDGASIRRSSPIREPLDRSLKDHSTELSIQSSHRVLDKISEKLAQRDGILRLPASKIQELASSPESLPLHPAPELTLTENGYLSSSSDQNEKYKELPTTISPLDIRKANVGAGWAREVDEVSTSVSTKSRRLSHSTQMNGKVNDGSAGPVRPTVSTRAVSTPLMRHRKYTSRKSDGKDEINPSTKSKRITPSPLQLDTSKLLPSSRALEPPAVSPDQTPSPMPQSLPLPPSSLPTYLQLELSSSRPSPLYIYRSSTNDFPYESSKIKFERLLNFLLLPPQLEQVLWYGALVCLDSWLYCFTILPLRFIIALGVLGKWWVLVMVREIRQLPTFVFWGLGRMRTRSHSRKEVASNVTPDFHERRSSFSKVSSTGKTAHTIKATEPSTLNDGTGPPSSSREPKRQRLSSQRHRRSKSTPSTLLPDHKADLLKGLIVLFSCLLLMRFDASRMYHGIRGQAAIKLYVIYNVLEVCDRLFSALGQDVFECLFSRETLERKPDGRSKVLRPFGMFLLALSYNVIHSTALFYQVITLNVAVNSYSNALLTLLMSNQFVEIKSTVFKKFEKENLFQLTCADVVERFQLWLMLMIIAMRNIVEMGGFSQGGSSKSSFWGSSALWTNATRSSSVFGGTLVPKSFTIFPKWTGQVFGPFLLVLGSEMLVDWLKHAYITKFNNTKPTIYGRFLDILAKDYYSNAFSDQNLTRRLGLPVIPLSCLFIRASLQTYHMFLATNVPPPIPSTATSLSVESASTASPATTAALQHFDSIIRRALGRSTFGLGGDAATRSSWSTDDVIAFITMFIFFLGVFFVLLALKLVLGMLLLGFARSRYKGMKEREKEGVSAGGRRIGGWGVVEVNDDKKRWIYEDDPEGARTSREREKVMREKQDKGDDLGNVSRYTMVAKRIW